MTGKNNFPNISNQLHYPVQQGLGPFRSMERIACAELPPPHDDLIFWAVVLTLLAIIRQHT